MEKNWNTTFKDFGEVEENTRHEFTFVYTGDKEYKGFKTSCGCTAGKWEDNSITASLKCGKVPTHAKQFGQSVKIVFLTIFFKDGSSDKLSLKATITC